MQFNTQSDLFNSYWIYHHAAAPQS